VTTTDTSINDAIDRLTRVRDLQDATAPLRRTLGQLDEDARGAAVYAERAGLTERTIADRLGVSQPTVHGWLDARRSEPLPAPSLSSEVWSLHAIAAALQGLVGRLEGRRLAENAPTSHHVRPVDAARNARKGAEEVTRWLSGLGAALDYEVASEDI
jgi:predicted transcriptional regulator